MAIQIVQAILSADKVFQIRRYNALRVGQFGDNLIIFAPEIRQAIPLLIKLLDHNDDFVASSAADTLRMIGPDARDAIGPLTAKTESGTEAVKRAAESALMHVDPWTRSRFAFGRHPLV